MYYKIAPILHVLSKLAALYAVRDEGYLKRLSDRPKGSSTAPASQMEHSIRVDSLRE